MMSRSSLIVTAVLSASLLVVVAVVALRRDGDAGAVTTRTATLENGVVVDVARVDGASAAAAALVFRVGDDHDPPGRSGLASVLRRVVRARLDAAHTPTRLDVVGGGSFTVLSTTGARGDVEQTLRALGALLASPTTSEDVVGAARAAAIDEVARRRGADPLLSARSWALESVAPSRGGGWRGGVADDLAGVAAADVDAFWRATFGGDQASVVVVGDVDVEDAIAVVERALGGLPGATAASLRPAATTFVHGTLVMGDQPRAVAFATPGPAPGEPSFAPFLILASRLQAAATTTSGPFVVDYDPAQATELVVASSLADGESADAGAARLRSAILERVKPPLAQGEVETTQARHAVLLGDATACAQRLQACAVARARQRQQGVAGDAIAAALASTTSLEAATAWFDEQHASVAAAGGVLR